MALVSVAIRLVLACTFSVAGLTKLADPKRTRQGIREFGVPGWAAKSVGFLLPLAELAVATCLVPASTVLLGSSAALILLFSFITGISINLARGRSPSCNCFGQVHSEPIGWSTLIRNCVLASGAGVVYLQGRNGLRVSVMAWTNGLSNSETVESILGVSVLLILTQGWLTLYLLRQKQSLILRIDAIEKKFTKASAANPSVAESTGLPIGSPAPSFELRALYGGASLKLDALLSEGRPLLLVFLDPDCGPCVTLLPDLLDWEQEQAFLTVALVSRGSEKANRARIQAHWFKYVLLQQDREVAAAYQVNGTPAAVLIGTDRLIASFVAMGSEEIANLIPSARTHPGSRER
jgi:peroxiredoxin/uncharacterized membrane protein YphA (DoxX/SURF4 family)